MTAPLVNPHLTATSPAFREAILDVVCGREMLRALVAATRAPAHCLQQVMLFEQAATPPHQDWVYLDSDPPGRLTAAWIALEDIRPGATRFFVVPGSQRFDRQFPEDWIWGSTRYTDAIAAAIESEFGGKRHAPRMRAGDVLLWNSRTIHGSARGTDPARSRLSLTAHYIPEGSGFGNRANPKMSGPPPRVDRRRPISCNQG
jgi:phytanoyl-CoA hydroxylase